MAESGNVNNRIAGKQIDMAKQDILISRSGHFPIVLLNAQYQYQDTAGLDATNATPTQMQMFNIPGSVLSNYSTGSVGLQVSIPISSGGTVNAQTRAGN